jgi:hypothetical protein
MGGTYSTHGAVTNLFISLKGRDCSEDMGVDARVILKWILEK